MKAYFVNTNICGSSILQGNVVYFSKENAKRKLKMAVDEFRHERGLSGVLTDKESIDETNGRYHYDNHDKSFPFFCTICIMELETEDVGCTVEGLISGDCFNISALSREDLKEVGFDGSKATEAQMRHLASKLGDDYCEQLFWLSLRILAEYEGIPTLPTKYFRASIYFDDGTNIDWKEPEELEGKVFRTEDDARGWMESHYPEADYNISEVEYTDDELEDEDIEVIGSDYETEITPKQYDRKRILTETVLVPEGDEG